MYTSDNKNLLFLASPEREILWAAEQGDLNLVVSLVSKQSALVKIQDKDGYTALHRACYSNHLRIVEVRLIYICSCILLTYVYSFY